MEDSGVIGWGIGGKIFIWFRVLGVVPFYFCGDM